MEWRVVGPLDVGDPAKIGPYTLRGRLGRGGMGQVYLGVSKTADWVAVKVIRAGLADDAHLRARFKSEVANLRRVYGARVARFEGADFDGDQPWLAVEYVPGRSLKEFVEDDGVLPTDLAVTLGLLLAEGLGKIHQEGLLHRDLKPQNILLGPDGPKVIDFGLAVLVGRDHQLTKTGEVVGTPVYMSPEQADGESDLTAATDVYSLAATLVYAATGRLLYGSLTGMKLFDAIRDPATLPNLSGLPSELVALFGQMLAHDPQARPSLSAVEETLLKLVEKPGRTVKELRDALTQRTATEPSLPSEPGEIDIEVAGEPNPEPTPEPVTTEQSAAMDSESAEPEPVAIDVGWLVAEVREQYDRKPVL